MLIRKSLTLAVLLAAAAALASPAAAQKREFSFAYDQPKQSGYGIGAAMFDKKLQELSKGTMSINQYPSAQLGTEAQTMQKVQTGDIDFVILSTANASTAQPESGVFSLHFIFRDEAHAIKVLADAKVIAAMRELYAAKIKGAHMIALGSQGLRHMYGKKAIEKIADIKGVKMRVQATVTEDTLFPAYGAQVVHMPFGEVYTALQTGVVDGQENTPSNMYTQKMDEVQKYTTLTNHGYIGYVVVVNKKFWDGLPNDVRGQLTKALKEATEYGNHISAKENAEALEEMKKKGKTQFLTLTADEMNAMKKAMEPIYADMGKRVGKDAIAEVQKAIGAH